MKTLTTLQPDAGQAFSVAGISSDSVKSYLLTRIRSPRLIGERVFWYVRTVAEAQMIQSFLEIWLAEIGERQTSVLAFGLDSLPLCAWKMLDKQPGWVIIPTEFFDQELPEPEAFRQRMIPLQTGWLGTPATLSQKLVSAGYEFNTSADAPGAFSRRGNLVDVFPTDSSHALRVEFGTRSIEKITILDRLKGTMLHPVKEWMVIPHSLSEDESDASIWSYIVKSAPDAWAVYSDPEEFDSVTEHWDELFKLHQPDHRIVFYSLPEPKAGNTTDFAGAPLYHHGLPAFIGDLRDWLNKDWTVYLPQSIKEDLERLWLKEHKDLHRPEVHYLDLPIISSPDIGFLSKKHKTILITDFELRGRSETPGPIVLPRKRRRFDVSFIAELKPGDYVVHLDHGIGRFVGLAKHTVDGITKEYFQLEYAANDKLSVPIELAYKIDKYIGSESPQIHRLSSTTWQQLKKRVKAETKKIADELLRLYAQRQTAQTDPCGPPTREESELAQSFPYQETPDQAVAIKEVNDDLEDSMPMDRLVCGDVGFGKTEVAIRAAFKVVMNKRQVAVLAPTTILAQQHFDTFSNRLKPFSVHIESLSRYKSAAQQKEAIAKLKTGEVDIIIGTHRLLSSDVQFRNLGLIIIDEEQRFGVRHKEKLKTMRVNSPILTLSATPIPRTLNLALSALRDMSVIKTPPEGRQPIETVISPFADEAVLKALRFELDRGGQAYYLHNRVETIQLAAAKLKRLIPEARIGIVHGRLPENELAKTMSDFDQGRTTILVATSIIENGLDLPNVNTLIVEDATRFGLAQLYQLRGRIGRGQRQAYSYFLYPQRKVTGEAKKRLQAILEAKELGSGFQVAMRDLEIRGVGNILGREQHGRVNAVGLSLYMRLLNQTITELETGRATKALRDIMIDLPVPFTIPTDYVTNENQRLQVYRELTEIAELDKLEEHFTDLAKRYGELPPNVENLKRLLRLKILAQDTMIDGLETVRRVEFGVPSARLVIKFSQTYTPPQIQKLLQQNPDWILGENQIKIDLENLAQPWLATLEKTIRVFQIGDETPDEDEQDTKALKRIGMEKRVKPDLPGSR